MIVAESGERRSKLTTQARLTRRRLIGGGLLTAGAIATGVAFASEPSAMDDGRARVTSTVGMIADVARNIGGEHIEAIGLMGPGVDPHLYKPSAGDIVRLGDADLIFYGGMHLEGRMAETFEKIDELGDTPAVAVSEAIPVDRRLRFGPEMWDPHVWFDVSLWRIAGERIQQALMETFPDHADDFAANGEAYLAELDELDAWVMQETHRVPEAQRVLVTAHDAFTYFGRRYGFEVRGLQGMSTAAEAGAGDVQDLAAFITERQIRAMFIESSVPPSTIEAVQAACRAKGWDVEIGGELYSDAMGESGTPEGTYIGMVRANVHTIVDALMGEEPNEA